MKKNLTPVSMFVLAIVLFAVGALMGVNIIAAVATLVAWLLLLFAIAGAISKAIKKAKNEAKR